MFGHGNVAILDGGLPGWINEGYDVSVSSGTPNPQPSHYQASEALTGVVSQADILALSEKSPQILDARPTGRFYGTTAEPRAGLRSGHIPGSQSWPFSGVVDASQLRTLEELKSQIQALDIDLTKPIITSCGSGITAAGLAFVLHLLGAAHVSVYDGSWTEWGASDAPISLED
jgi:thiosulfate/3-mercaptopyruvate sulfurtransferase